MVLPGVKLDQLHASSLAKTHRQQTRSTQDEGSSDIPNTDLSAVPSRTRSLHSRMRAEDRENQPEIMSIHSDPATGRTQRMSLQETPLSGDDLQLKSQVHQT